LYLIRDSLSSFISRAPQSSGRSANARRRFQFHKRSQLFIRSHNETLSVGMRPNAKRLESVCHNTLPWLISVSLGETGTVRRMTTQKIASGTVHKLPADFRKAIESNAAAKSLWTDITPLARNEWICWVTSAKKEETRKRRIEIGIDKLRGGMRRPCCWPGCPHR
jgi:bacteriocin resistance YdeI/OmpD-like protein